MDTESRVFIEGITPQLTLPLSRRQIHAPTEIQRLVIPCVLQGKSLAFRSATGTGKTFAYLLPLLQKLLGETGAAPRALIIAPTLELCSQIQGEAEFLLSECPGLRSVPLLGGANIARQVERLRREKPAVIVGNVKRVIELIRTRKLRAHTIAYFALDEADRLLSSEQIEDTQALIALLPRERVNIACSATLGEKMRERLNETLHDELAFIETDANEIIRERITHWAVWSENNRLISTIHAALAALGTKKTLVFAENAQIINKITGYLQQHKVSALSLYSGQDKKERKHAIDDFRGGKLRVLVASDLAARGLDIDNINHVLCAGVREDSEAYIHRAGRTARCGKSGVCISIGNEADMYRLRAIEKKLRLTVYPKVVYAGRIIAPEEM